MKPYTYKQTLFIKSAFVYNEKIDGQETGNKWLAIVANDPIKPKLYDERIFILFDDLPQSIISLLDHNDDNLWLRTKEIVLDVVVTKKINNIH